MSSPDRIEFFVAGTPRARPRERHGVRTLRSGKVVSCTYRPTKIRISKKTGKPTPESLAWARAEQWYRDVAWAVRPYLPAQPWDGPVRCEIEVYFERPERLLKKGCPDGLIWYTAKPDRDNTDKSVLDALTKAGLWRDDAQVCDGPVRKFYAERGAGPGVRIIAERIVGGSEAATQGHSDTGKKGGRTAAKQGPTPELRNSGTLNFGTLEAP